MLVSLSEASRLTGKSKSVISNALKNGTISYASKDSTGYKIDTSELFRVFERRTPEPRSRTAKRTIENPQKNPHQNTQNTDHEIEMLKLKLQQAEQQRDLYKEKAMEWKEQSDGWKKQANQLLLQSNINNDHQSHQDKQQKIPKETVREIQENAIIAYKKHLIALKEKKAEQNRKSRV